MDHFQDLRTDMVLKMQASRHGRRVPSPRSGHRRTGGNRLALQHAAEFRRQHDEVQVHHQERGGSSTARRSPSCPSRFSRTTARACTRTSRCGKAASRSSPATATRDCRRWRCGTPADLLKHAPRALGLHRARHELLQAPRARLRSAGEPGVLAAQPLGRGAHPGVFGQARRRSASSSGRRTRRAIRISPFRPC